MRRRPNKRLMIHSDRDVQDAGKEFKTALIAMDLSKV